MHAVIIQFSTLNFAESKLITSRSIVHWFKNLHRDSIDGKKKKTMVVTYTACLTMYILLKKKSIIYIHISISIYIRKGCSDCHVECAELLVQVVQWNYQDQ